MIILIAAVSKNYALGKENKMIWHLPNDFKRFKALTTGHHIIMGRKTFESLPGMLPNRKHIVITHQENYNHDDCLIAKSFEEALTLCPSNEDVYVIGGAQIYNIAINFADKIELTMIDATFEADAFFPEIDTEKWRLESENCFLKDDKHNYDYCFQTFCKNKLTSN